MAASATLMFSVNKLAAQTPSELPRDRLLAQGHSAKAASGNARPVKQAPSIPDLANLNNLYLGYNQQYFKLHYPEVFANTCKEALAIYDKAQEPRLSNAEKDKLFTQALKLSPKSAMILLDRADLSMYQSQFHAALVDCDQALKSDPRLLPARTLKASIYFRTQRLCAG
jgi:tetratricopeptide (TPR) repeat protein